VTSIVVLKQKRRCTCLPIARTPTPLAVSLRAIATARRYRKFPPFVAPQVLIKLSSHQTGQLEEIARGNPQWPQAFYGMSHVFDVEEGDILFGRCTFDSTHKNKTTYIGNYECY
jgi:Copper type II ascorbate-dependent monooxygenase, C-terminal domain